MERKQLITVIVTVILTGIITGITVWYWPQTGTSPTANTPPTNETNIPNENLEKIAKKCSGWCVDENGYLQYAEGLNYADRELTKSEEHACASQGWCGYADHLVTGKVLKINDTEKTIELSVDALLGTEVDDPITKVMPLVRESYTLVVPIPDRYISNNEEIKIKVGQIVNVTNKYLIKRKFIETGEAKVVWNAFQESKTPIIGVFSNGKLIYNNEEYELKMADSSKILNVPQTRLDQRMVGILQSTNEENIWFGLLSSLSRVINNGENIEIVGKIDKIGKRIQVESIKVIR